MFSQSREIQEGDIVIIWFTREECQPLTVTSGKELHGRFGVYRHADMIGMPYGSKMASKNGKGFIHILRPTPELWTLALPHRTQILYLADISFIVSWLGIKPGTVVVEAGTGSGSFSHSVARTIGPTGHLHTFEFHEARMLAAKEEFTRHGMSSFVTLKHQNVCRDGFGLTNVADAVFLDLPAPWDAIGSAKQALKKDCTTRICCFSPCIEQVLRTVSSLNDAGFTDITMYEVLIRPQDISATPSLRNIEEASDKLKASAIRREARRLRQIEQSRLAYEAKQKAKELESVAITDGDVKILTDTGDISPGLKRKREDETPVIMLDAIKRPKSEAVDTDAPNGMDIDEVPASHPVPKISPSRMDSPAPNSHSSTPGPSSVKVELMNVSRPFAEVRGHTSYLTFAVLLPATFLASAAIISNSEGINLEPPGLDRAEDNTSNGGSEESL